MSKRGLTISLSDDEEDHQKPDQAIEVKSLRPCLILAVDDFGDSEEITQTTQSAAMEQSNHKYPHEKEQTQDEGDTEDQSAPKNSIGHNGHNLSLKAKESLKKTKKRKASQPTLEINQPLYVSRITPESSELSLQLLKKILTLERMDVGTFMLHVVPAPICYHFEMAVYTDFFKTCYRVFWKTQNGSHLLMQINKDMTSISHASFIVYACNAKNQLIPIGKVKSDFKRSVYSLYVLNKMQSALNGQQRLPSERLLASVYVSSGINVALTVEKRLKPLNSEDVVEPEDQLNESTDHLSCFHISGPDRTFEKLLIPERQYSILRQQLNLMSSSSTRMLKNRHQERVFFMGKSQETILQLLVGPGMSPTVGILCALAQLESIK